MSQKECIAKFLGKINHRDLMDTADDYEKRGQSATEAMLSSVKDKIQELEMERTNIFKAVRDAFVKDGGKPHAEIAYKRRDVESYDFTDGSIDDINDLGNFNLDYIDVKELSDAEFAAKIEAELMEEMYGFTDNKGKTPHGKKVNLASTLDKNIKAKGLHPEDAFPDFDYKELSDGKRQAAFEVNGKTYFANFKDTVGPRITTENGMGSSVVAANVKGDLSGIAESHGFTALSDEAKQAWNKRIATSAELFRRGFDIYTSVSKESRQRVAEVWKEIAKNPEAFEFNKVEKPTGKTYQDVAQDIANKMLDGSRYEMSIEKLKPGEEAFYGDGFTILIKDNKTNGVSEAVVQYDRIDKQVVMHTEKLDKGSGAGKPVYQVGQAFATAFNVKIKADHMLLGVNNYRRTEQMFSGMLRSGRASNLRLSQSTALRFWTLTVSR